MKQPQFRITRDEKGGELFYALSCPAFLSPDKKKKRFLFKRRADAEKKRAELVAAMRAEPREAVLSNAQLVDARRAYERLAEAGMSMSLDKAIEIALPLLQAHGRYVPVERLLADFEEGKREFWRGHTLRNFKVVARMFLEQHAGLTVAEVTPKVLDSWLRSFGRPAYAAGLVRTLRPAFTWAVRQGMLDSNPFGKLEPIRVRKTEAIDVFTPEEARRLMELAPTDCKAAYAVLLFAGVRPVELTRLTWGDVRDGFIHITPNVAKTAQVRNVEIEPTLAAWLESTGRHVPTEKICPPNWKRKNQTTRKLAGVADRQDTARHSYATYHLAKYRDRAALEENMGHTAGSAMLMRHYRAAATPQQAEAYWAILPE